jgi:hypothetical protein
MIRLIYGFVILSCLLLTSCNFPEKAGQTKRSTSPPNNQVKKPVGSQTNNAVNNAQPPIDWPRVSEIVDNTRGKFTAVKDGAAQPTVKQVLDEINKATSRLPKEEDVDARCGTCGEDVKANTKRALTLLAEIAGELKGKEEKNLSDLDPSLVSKIRRQLEDTTTVLTEANTSYSRSVPLPGSNDDANAPENNAGGGGSEPSWTDWIWPIAGGIAALGLIVLAVFGILRWRSGFWMKFDGHVSDIVSAHMGGVKKRHDEMAKNLAAIGEDQRKTSSRLESIEGEIQALGRRLRQGALDAGGYQAASVKQAFDEYARQPLPVEPEFPAAADQYLNKMKRNSTVVKPDFQNGILVNDIDGKGELVLIRDANLPDDAQPLFVVPRVTQFQSKQEFHSYYERYYECQKPSAGDVWIIDPAIVSTVPGGWELREKGVLEVR